VRQLANKSNKKKFNHSPLNLIYPNKGNFIGFIGNPDSGSLISTSIASFRRQSRFPSDQSQ
jgi:hypothetical protein